MVAGSNDAQGVDNLLKASQPLGDGSARLVHESPSGTGFSFCKRRAVGMEARPNPSVSRQLQLMFSDVLVAVQANKEGPRACAAVYGH